MCTAQVRRLHQETGRKVVVVDRFGKPRFHDLFRNNPRISNDPGNTRLLNGPGARPYIEGKTATHWAWQRWDIQPGEIYLTSAERGFASTVSGSLLIEPNTKVPNGNKTYPWERWQSVVDMRSDWPWVQVGQSGARRLRGVRFVETPSFRQAASVMKAAIGFVGSEGALHHAAAAMNVPATVIWSHFIDPIFTGYQTQRNLRRAEGWCGARVSCAECAASMLRITPHEIVSSLDVMLENSPVQTRHAI